MTDLPKAIRIVEEGPREGFQCEKAEIPTARKIELIDALSETGLKHIQVVSFVSPKAVPQMRDAEDVVAGMKLKPGVHYTGLWLNEQGLRRAIATQRLDLEGVVALTASAGFSVFVLSIDYKLLGAALRGAVRNVATAVRFRNSPAMIITPMITTISPSDSHLGIAKCTQPWSCENSSRSFTATHAMITKAPSTSGGYFRISGSNWPISSRIMTMPRMPPVTTMKTFPLLSTRGGSPSAMATAARVREREAANVMDP